MKRQSLDKRIEKVMRELQELEPLISKSDIEDSEEILDEIYCAIESLESLSAKRAKRHLHLVRPLRRIK